MNWMMCLGIPKCESVAIMKACERDGKAALKSKKIAAREEPSRAAVLMPSSTSTTFCSRDLPPKKPCCAGETALSSTGSMRRRTALAIRRLSAFTMERGRVSEGAKYSLPARLPVAFFGKNTIRESLKMQCPSGPDRCVTSSFSAPSLVRSMRAWKRTFCPKSPRRL